MIAGFTSALRGLAANKLRSFLTTLGVIFGVAAVIVAVALGQGSRDASMRRFQRLGTTTISVLPGRQNRGGITFGTVSTLKLKDALAILKNCPSVRRVSAEKGQSFQTKHGNKNSDPSIYGCGPDLIKIRHYELKEGRFFTDDENKRSQSVCVLGSGAFKDLFGSGTSSGQTVLIKGHKFKVLGSLKERGGGGFINEDDRIYVPILTGMRQLFGGADPTAVGSMSVEGRSEAQMQRAQDEVTAALRKSHALSDNKQNDFIIFNAGTQAQASSEQAADFEQLINCLAAVALLVGGIGIMNIMLVSVTERTREIGVRKAVGAKRRDILLQFLMEALVLSLTGGLIGVVFGIAFTLFGLPAMKPDWETTLTVAPIVVAFSFSALVGIFFGFYPAWKASMLNPIDALRYE